jgi:GH24 family phage-related lysozyme (muramidase)
MYLMNGSTVVDKIACTSGQSYAQDVVWPTEDTSGSMRPLPEGIYDIGVVDDLGYDPGASDGFGQWVYPLEPRAKIKRSLLRVHSDRNRSTSAGSAGCLCPYSVETMLKFVTWQRMKARPGYLVMDHGLGFLKQKQEFTAPNITKKPNPATENHQSVAGNEIPQAAIDLIKEFEGCELEAYDDGVGVWTIGWGSTKYADGSQVRAGDIISQTDADQLFKATLKGYWERLASTPYWGEMSANQKSVLLSFSYNTGWNYGDSGFTTMNRVIGDKNWTGVPAAFNLYVNPGTSTEAGLRRRRKAESALWDKKS